MYRRYTDGVLHPPLVSEYEGADSGGVPELFVSMPATCRDVSDELLDFMWYRGMSIPEVAAVAGISGKAAEDLIQKGKGDIRRSFRVVRRAARRVVFAP